jgi:hypothetical protein
MLSKFCRALDEYFKNELGKNIDISTIDENDIGKGV